MTHYDTDIIAYNSVIIVTRFADGSGMPPARPPAVTRSLSQVRGSGKDNLERVPSV